MKFSVKRGKELTIQEVVRELNSRLVLQEVRNSDLIEIGVLDTNAKRAADIANSIARTYQKRRLQDLQSSIDRSLAQFREEVNHQREAVEEAAIEVAKLREILGIIDPDPESHGSSIQTPMNDTAGKNAGTRYTTAKVQYLQAKKILEAAELRYSTARMERGVDVDPAKIWENAEPAAKPVGFQPVRALERLFNSYWR
jgi:uncharacterized protein involved in exopolysaccharide biosynthesis